MEVSNRLQGIGEYYFSAKLREIEALRQSGKDIINLGIGSPDQPPHPMVIDTLVQSSRSPKSHAYQSYKGKQELRNAIVDWYAKYYKVQVDADKEILPIIGSKEGIMHICMTFLNEGDQVLIPNPGYPTYQSAATIAGGKCITYDLTYENNYQPDWTRLEEIPHDSIKLAFINYPHMPTGTQGTIDVMTRWVEWAKRKNVILIHDNPYSHILTKQPLSIFSIPEAKTCALELNSLSKSHNMAGWRLGMIVGQEDYINAIMRFMTNMESGIFGPLQDAAAVALRLNDDWYRDLNEMYQDRKEVALQILQKLNCQFNSDQVGMFVWGRIPSQYKDAYILCDELLYEKNVFITPGGIFGSAGNECIRISLCTSKEILMTALQRISK